MPVATHGRRALLRALAALPAATLFPKLHAFAAPDRGKVRITAIRAMAMKNIANNSLVRIDTDAGVSGFGEAGASGPMARARIETMKQYLIGRDPLAIEVHFHQMTSIMHTSMAQIGVISGIDMALWDLAGKLLNRRVCDLMGGPFREEIAMYSHGIGVNMLDPCSCGEWAARVKAMPAWGAVGPVRQYSGQRRSAQGAARLSERPRCGGRRDRRRGSLPQRVRHPQRHRRGEGRGADESAVPGRPAERDFPRRLGRREAFDADSSRSSTPRQPTSFIRTGHSPAP